MEKSSLSSNSIDHRLVGVKPPDMQRLKSDLILATAAFVWGSGFLAQRVAAQHIGTFIFNGSRFLIGSLFLWLILRCRWKPQKDQLPWMAGAGVLLFCASGFQQAGLASTSVSNAGFITGLYVVIIPIFEWIIWGTRARWSAWIAAALAVCGTTLMSGGNTLTINRGDVLVLLGSVFWALHVIVVGRATRHMDPASFSLGQFIIAGAVNLVFGLVFEYQTISGIPAAVWAILYSAVFAITIGFTLQAVGQKNAPTLDAALILSLETVFAALFGVLVLHETFGWPQLWGSVLILSAIVLVQVLPGSAGEIKRKQSQAGEISSEPGG